ncbi:MAG: PEP-CTERM sorting domain-containing protein [Opitutales bacterium]|nr:PEP-CTERM sorting domain-containing protein [Opitutales bacterium]
MNTKTSLFAAAGLGLLVSLQASTLVVGYSGTGYVSANQPLGGAGTAFDSGVPISPAAGYTGPTFYGAVATSDSSAAPISDWAIFNDLFFANIPLTSDWIGIATGSTMAGADKHHYGLVFFKQEDFSDFSTLPGGVRLSADTKLSFRVRRTGGNPSFVRFVIETDAGFFASSSTELSSGQANGVELVALADPTSTNWFTYDPATSISVVGGASNPDLTNVIGMGIWFDNVRAGSAMSGMGFYVTDIQLTAIPEPSTYAALFGLLAIGFVLVRRRVWA